MGNTFGKLFRVTTWGESHGGAVGVVVDGCPPRLEITKEEIQFELDRRKPGQSSISTKRSETDEVQILSGVFEGKTLGTPICMFVKNKDARPEAYLPLKEVYRPSHADFTYQQKYCIRNWQGGGRASARETIGRVAAGAIAKKVLACNCQTEIIGYVRQIGEIEASVDSSSITIDQVEKNIVRCPDDETASKMIEFIEKVGKENDSVGGIVEMVARNVPIGLGEPVFDKLKAVLAKAMMSIPASMGFQIGSGFSSASMKGSEHNDEFYYEDGKIRTRTNNSGGIQGGISNGENIILQVAFKPTPTLGKPQKTVDIHGKEVTLAAKGRHDACVVPRAVPIVEAMAAITLLDQYLRHKAQCG